LIRDNNFFNDAIDARKGADTERRLGPVRPIRQLLLAGMNAGGLAAALRILYRSVKGNFHARFLGGASGNRSRLPDYKRVRRESNCYLYL